MSTSAFPSQLTRFVHDFAMIAGWLDEVWVGITTELPPESYPGGSLRTVVFEMLYGTIETALASIDPQDLERATEIMNLAATSVEEHLARGRDLIERDHVGANGDGRTDG